MGRKLNLQNLKPFKKGQSGNPNGRPKLPDIKEALELLLSDVESGKTKLEMVINALYKRAIKGDVRAIQELLDRMYGKAQQKTDITTGGEKIKQIFKIGDQEIEL